MPWRILFLFLVLSIEASAAPTCDLLFMLNTSNTSDPSPVLGLSHRLSHPGAVAEPVRRIRHLLREFIPEDFVVPIVIGPVVRAEAEGSESATVSTIHVTLQTRTLRRPETLQAVLAHELGHVGLMMALERDLPDLGIQRFRHSEKSQRLKAIQNQMKLDQTLYQAHVLLRARRKMVQNLSASNEGLEAVEARRQEKDQELLAKEILKRRLNPRTPHLEKLLDFHEAASGHSEMFADLVAAVFLKRPSAVADAIQDVGESRVPLAHLRDFDTQALIGSEIWKELDPHYFYLPARKYIWDRIRHLDLDQWGQEIIERTYVAIFRDLQKSKGLWDHFFDSPAKANERLIRELETALSGLSKTEPANGN